MIVCQCTHRLEFKDYLSKAKDIRYVLLLDLLALVENRQFLLGLKWNVPLGEFLLQTLLIHLFTPHVAHGLVDVKQRTLNGIHFVTIKQLVFHAAYYIIWMSVGLEPCCFFVCVRVIFVSRRLAENRRVKRCASRSAKVVATMNRPIEANLKANGDELQAEP